MLLAGKLSAAGVPTAVWTRSGEQARRIREEGIALQDADGTVRLLRMEAIPAREAPAGFDGLLLLAVKQTAITEDLIAELARIVPPGAPLALFQNGIGHPERLAAGLPGRVLIPAVTTEGALRTGPASVTHTGLGETWIGVWRGASENAAGEVGVHPAAAELERGMKQAGFSVSVSNNIRERMLRKIVVNAVINPLTALWRVPNGELPATPERRAVMEALFRETVDVLRLNGLGGEDAGVLWENVLGVCAATAGNRSSMLQDVLAGRPTEIQALNGEIARLAAGSGRDAPWNSALTALVQAIRSNGESGA